MESDIVKVITDGRVTLPKGWRKRHDIHEGDHIEIGFIRKINKGGS